MHIEFSLKNTSISARSVFVLHGHRLSSASVVVLIASVTSLTDGMFSETVN